MNNQFGNNVCGLYYNDDFGRKRVYLPQVQLKTHTTINPVCHTTQLTQTFHNPNNGALPQVRYCFPLFDGVAVNGYTISYGSKVLKGVVKQKDVAKATYQAAVDRGETAGLLESLPAGIFGVTLGNVPAKADVVVEITYCGELKHDAAIDGLRFTIPTVIAPRYGNYPGEVLQSNSVAKGGIRITVDMDMATSAIRKVQSPSHPISVTTGSKSTTEGSKAPFIPSHASATLTLGSTELGADFVLQLLIDDISKPQAILETHPTWPNQRAIMTTLVPKFILEPAHPEIVFLADQSGSMSGGKNTALVSALKIFLKSLPLGVRFNICAFGNNFKFLWPKSQAYNQSNLNSAMSFVNSFNASYGGTEILRPIVAAFEQHLSDLPFEVMLLTDGQVWQEDQVFKYINEQIHDKKVDARVFALGIGTDVSHTLVEGVARAGNGFAQFVTQNEETDQKVIRMLKAATYAHTKDYELEVHFDDRDGTEMGDDDFELVEKVNDCLSIADTVVEPTENAGNGSAAKATSFFDETAELDSSIKTDHETTDRYAHLPTVEPPRLLQSPTTIPPLFPVNRTSAYVLLGPDVTQKKVTSVTLRAKSSQGPLELNIPVSCASDTSVATIHQLATRKAVQDLEEGRGWLSAAKTTDDVAVKTKHESRFDEIVERECVRLGERFQVTGKWTSFVAVDEKRRQEEAATELSSSDTRVDLMGYDALNRTYVAPISSSAVNPQASSLFAGAGDVQSAGSFGSGSVFGSARRQEAAASGGLFGGGGLFAVPQSGGGSLFGGIEKNTTGTDSNPFSAPTGSLFGGQQYNETSTGGSLFGNGQGPGLLFGSKENQNSPPGRGIFGQNAQDVRPAASSSSAVFGIPQMNQGHPSSLGVSESLGTTGSGSDWKFRFAEPPTSGSPSEASKSPQDFDSAWLTSASSNALATPHAMLASSNQLGGVKAISMAKRSKSSFPNILPSMPNPFRQRTASVQRVQAPSGWLGLGGGLSIDACRSVHHSVQEQEFAADEDESTFTMHSLIDLQTFSGAWPWNDELFSILGIDQAQVNKKELGGDAETCATALAIAYLETRLPAQKSVWEMVVSKAKAWLMQQVGADGVDAVLARAKLVFSG